ncbi:MAG: ABC transporter permease [Blastocatellia bacterium]|nr:ABC transporter permease [Blastocatellia bacterium]
METLLQDLRYGARTLIKQPGFTAVAVLALALGIGANTAIFSAVNAVLLRSLSYKEPDRLMVVWERNFPRNRETNVVSPANFLDWQSQNHVFEQMAAIASIRTNLTGAGEPEEIATQIITADFFSIMGVQPLLGRAFIPEEFQQGKDNVVVLSQRLWQRRFGADPGVVGRAITISGQPHVVVGIMPPRFYFVNKDTEMWAPMLLDTGRDYRKIAGRYLLSVARLKSGVTIGQAQAEMTALASRLEQEHPDFNSGWGVNIVPIYEEIVGDIRIQLLILLGAVAFVLLIACANVANLLLARASSRQKEIALRAALGAGRFRIIRQLLTESVLLAALGGAAGLALAYWGVKLLISLSPKDIPRLDEIGIDMRVLGFTLAVSLLTGVIFGLLPALQSSRPDLNESLKEGGRSQSGGRAGHRARGLFVVTEVALALVLLIGAGLMIKSFVKLQQVDPGFDSQKLLTMRMLLPRSKYREDQQRVVFFDEAVRKISALPGVEAAGTISFLPLAGLGSATSFHLADKPEPPPGEKPVTEVRVIGQDYFKAMGIPLLKGRLFTERDTAESPRVLIINETMARQMFPNEDPLGKRLIISWGDDLPDEIIGVVRDIKPTSLDADPRPMIYWPHRREPYGFMNILVRASVDPVSLSAAAQREIRAIDSEQPIAEIQAMETVVSESIAKPRFTMLLLGIFAALALLLAAVGIYGVMSYSVTQRTHEIGIRMALGAERSDILRLVVGRGMLLALIGVVIGLIAAFILTSLSTPFISDLLYSVTATDTTTFIAIPLLLALIALLSCYIPARRATKVDPMVALRYE